MRMNAGLCSPQPLLLDGPAAAEFTGVSMGVLQRWVTEGLPFVRVGRGGRKMYTRRDLEQFVERRKERANP